MLSGIQSIGLWTFNRPDETGEIFGTRFPGTQVPGYCHGLPLGGAKRKIRTVSYRVLSGANVS